MTAPRIGSLPRTRSGSLARTCSGIRARRAILAGRRHGGARAWAGLALIGALAVLWLAAASRVHVNASWSDDAWGYLVLPIGEPGFGDAVLFEPATGGPVPYLKTVRGLPGDSVSVDEDRTVRVDGAAMGRAKEHALDGRPLGAIRPGVIPQRRYYVHADHRDSHDSRYAEIGLVSRENILGRALALPDLPWIGLEGPLVGPEDAGLAAETLVPETRR